MKRAAVAIGVAIVTIVLLVWAVRILFPSDERRIRRALDELADTASIPDGETDLARLARTARLRRFLIEDVRVDVGQPYAPVEGRDALLGAAAAAQAGAGETRFEFVDVAVTVAPDAASATTHLTVEARGRDPRTDEGTWDARELELSWRNAKENGQWQIARVTASNHLRE